MNKEIYHEGWLIKSPPTKRIWRARWRRRWFTLKQGEIPGQFCLEYYTDRNCRKLKGVIDLDQCEQVDSGLRLEHRKQKFQFMFDIKTLRRTYYLAADTENDMRDWVNCICQVCNLHDFTKESGEHREYYNLCENSPSITSEKEQFGFTNKPEIPNKDLSTATPQPENVPHVEQDFIRRTSENTYQNELPNVNSEYSNRETIICDTSLKDPLQLNFKKELKVDSKCARSDRGENSNCFEDLKNSFENHLNDGRSTMKTVISPSVVKKKIPENLILSDTLVEDRVEPSPALSTCSGPYIPISECFSGSPKFMNEETPATPLNNLDPKFYDTPRSHNNIGLNLTNDQSYSPKIYNCPQLKTKSGRSSPTDSESVFSDDEEWSHPMPLRESIDRNMRRSDSSVENEAIVFTYTQRFSKIPDDSQCQKGNVKSSILGAETDKTSKRKNHFKLKNTSQDEKNRDIPQLSDTENTSPAIGPGDSSTCVEESYDIPRSHHLPYHNMSQLTIKSMNPVAASEDMNLSNLNSDDLATSTPNTKTLPRPHFYTNAAPTKIEGNVFRYDFIEQYDAPAVNRSLKPKLSFQEKPVAELPAKALALCSNAYSKKCVKQPPHIDRNLKPTALKKKDQLHGSNSLRRSVIPASLIVPNDNDCTINRNDNSSISSSNMGIYANSSLRHSNTAPSKIKSNSQLQYFDLDVANPPPQVNRSLYANSTQHSHKISSPSESSSRTSPKSSIVYNSVDFLKTEAFKRIREDAEKNRMKD